MAEPESIDVVLTKKLEKLLGQWPKRAGCDRLYGVRPEFVARYLPGATLSRTPGRTEIDVPAWAEPAISAWALRMIEAGPTHNWERLELAAPFEDGFATFEQRHCDCGCRSTLVVMTSIKDLAEE